MKKIFLFLIMTALAAVMAVNATAGSSLPAIIMLLLGKPIYNGPPLSHQAAMVGPLSGSSIQAFQVDDLRTAQEGPIDAAENNSNLLSAGTFDLSLTGVADSAWVVVAASGGEDIDADGNGVADTAPTENQGTLHALARTSDWRTKHIRITPLTEIGWWYVENMIPAVSAEELEIRLADLARYLVKTDISGNGTVDWDDILAFDPANAAHCDKLAFDYTWLTTANDTGQTILASLQAGETEAVLTQLDETFSWLMTRFPVPDSRYHSVKVELAVFGSGSAASGAPHNLSVDSTLAESIYEDHAFFSENASEQITFTATPTAETQILSWAGCETISADLTQCSVPLDKSRSVVVNFGWIETQLKAPVHDLSRAYNIVGANTVSVLLPDDMDDLIAEMAAANVDDFVVGDDGGGFLRRIIGINQISSTYYQLDTAEAALDEVIERGTGHLYKQLTNADLEGYTAPSAPGQQATVAPTAFTGLQGVALDVSSQPNDTTFTITLGESSAPPLEDFGAESEASGSLAANVTIFDDGAGATLTASGEIELSVSFDKDIDLDWGKLQYFKLIAIVEAKESVTLTASSELAKFDKVKKKIGTLRFAPIPVGTLPIWITPMMDVYLFAEGKIEAEATFGAVAQQRVEGGILYNRDTGFTRHKNYSADSRVTPPSGNITASIKGGVETAFSTKICDVTGPSIPMERYIKIAASVEGELFGYCTDIAVQFAEGSNISFKWDMSGSTKIGQLLHLDQLEDMTEFSISVSERNVAKWTVYSTCPRASFLSIDGDGIFSTIDLGDPSGIATVLTISNTGDDTLHWNTSGVPSEVTINPSSGVLAPGAQEVVLMSVATTGLPAGRYLRKPFFYNEASVGQSMPDDEFGNTYKTIDITVNGPMDDTPTITSLTSPAAGQVTIDWSFTSSGSDPFIGFQIYATRTPDNPDTYRLVYTTDIYDRQAVISGFTPGATYSFDMRVYSNDGARPGPFSNKVTVQVAGTPPAVIPTALNDTGITFGGNYPSGNNTSCTGVEIGAQDCSHGRDVTHNDDSDGHAGFSYTKLDSNGVPLADQNADYATTPWACVRDNVTGLIWEVKTNDGGLHDKDDRYNWYNTDPATNGGTDGYADDDGDICYGYDSSNSATFCNTEAYVNRVNAAGWCGASDWRMPTRKELEGLVTYDRSSPAIDLDYFPNAVSSSVWSGSPHDTLTYGASWYVNFFNGSSNAVIRNYDHYVRLVRGGQ